MKFKELLQQYIDQIEGGKGDNISPKDLDTKQLLVGMMVEKEHTNDNMIALEIAVDHITEDVNYYHKLIAADLVDEKPALNLYNKLYLKNLTN